MSISFNINNKIIPVENCSNQNLDEISIIAVCSLWRTGKLSCIKNGRYPSQAVGNSACLLFCGAAIQNCSHCP